MGNVVPFHFKDREIRVIEEGETLWFVAQDVCAALELVGNAFQYHRRLDADQKGMIFIHTLGGGQNVVVLNESGLYDIVLRSNKPQAKPFRKWVTSEVLPSIRKTGCYSISPVRQINPEESDKLYDLFESEVIKPFSQYAEMLEQSGYELQANVLSVLVDGAKSRLRVVIYKNVCQSV